MNFEDLKAFLEEAIMFENYQPVIVRTLLESPNYRAEREILIRKLKEANNNEDRDYTQILFDVTHEVLNKPGREIIIWNTPNEYSLNITENLNVDQQKQLIDLCNERMEDVRQRNSNQKIAICWPTDNSEQIDSFIDIIKKKGKSLWGVNWKASRIEETQFPLQGYIYFRQKIIAVAIISKITDLESTPAKDLDLRPESVHLGEKYKSYLHLTGLQRIDPFSHMNLELIDPNKKMPSIVQNRVYVKEMPNLIFQNFNCWIWSVTPENWEIVKKNNVWASKIGEKIRTKIHSRDKVIFYVVGTGEFQGISEFEGEWYDAKGPIWSDETDSVIYQSQIKLKPLRLGHVSVYEIAPKLKLFPDPADKRGINLVLKGGSGYPSNNGKPILQEDYQTIFNSMSEAIYTVEIDDPKLAEYALILTEKKQIVLYGPPGTGKTYLARQLASRFFSNDYLKNKKSDEAFTDLQNAHLVDIVQFHPSYSYEDFIEGIRPFSDQTNSSIKYDVQDGIFKKICREAQEVNDGSEHYFALINDYVKIPKPMRAEDLGLDRSHGGGMNELSKDEFKKILDYVKASGETIPQLLEESTFSGYFRLNTKENSPYGDIDGSRYHFSQYAHSYSKFLGSIQQGNVAIAYHDRERGGFIGVGIIYKNNYVKNPKFILIIDEINRGNLSKIFGEIIYGLEYRGQPIRTQYSEFNGNASPLIVPSNLLIIGTMNTADRSITLFDIAIRRRFAFLELLPDYDLLVRTLGLGEKFDNRDLLTKLNSAKGNETKFKILSVLALAKINEEIITKIQLGREKQVGHSYFLQLAVKPEQFYNVWKYEVIPLLEEYFYAKSDMLENLLSQKIFTSTDGIKNFTIKDLEDSLTNLVKR